MFRALVGALAILTVGFFAAQPAGAARIYAGQPTASVPDELVLALSNSGTAITKITFHLDVSCGTDFESVDFGSTQNVDTLPDRMANGAHYLVAGKVAGGKLSGTIVGADAIGDTSWELMNVVLSGTVAKSRASGTMAIKLARTDAASGATTAQCSRVVRWSALRNPGIVYAGATSQNEPIVIELKPDRKHVNHAHVAWFAPCTSGGAWIDPHDEFDLKAYPLSRTGAFSRTYRFGLGGGALEIERFIGRVSPTKASGTFQSDVTITGSTGTSTCSTGKVSWTAATG